MFLCTLVLPACVVDEALQCQSSATKDKGRALSFKLCREVDMHVQMKGREREKKPHNSQTTQE